MSTFCPGLGAEIAVASVSALPLWHHVGMGGSIPSSSDPYSNPELFRFVGSMEGVPDFLDLAETAEERAAREGWRASGHGWLEGAGTVAPGLVLAFCLAVAGRWISQWTGDGVLGLEKSPLSPILIAILGGLLIRNTVGLPSVYESGLQLCLKRVLRIGVALLGIRLSLAGVGGIGLAALPIIIACILGALVIVAWVSRLLSLPGRLGILVAVGTAICGNTAIVATGPAINASEDEVAYAVGTITVFGLLALLVHPFIAHAIFSGNEFEAGLFLGTAIHDTAQVAGAGLLYGQQFDAPRVLDIATVTKLVRNVFMLAIIPLMAFVYQRVESEPGEKKQVSLRALIPFFVLGFVGMAFLRTLGDMGDAPFGGLLSPGSWASAIEGASTLSAWCLTVAMASVGLGTQISRLRVLGLRPLAAGLVAALVVGIFSAGLILVFGSALESLALSIG
jgi:uncharacterized integral membrane protein (TIGR00698 family)